MRSAFNIYCDESCHMENDRQPVMVMGAVWCALDKVHDINKRLREIKHNHQLPGHFEVKWTKVSPAKLPFYRDIVDYFFDDDDLHFRVLIVSDKTQLDHEQFGQDHDTWYYKMYFEMLKVILQPSLQYRVYLDIKDTRSGAKIRKLHEVLCNSLRDFDRSVVPHIQTIRSHESQLMQLADLLIGAVMCANRGISPDTSRAKVALVRHVRERSGYSLTRKTLLQERKFNVFVWQASGAWRL